MQLLASVAGATVLDIGLRNGADFPGACTPSVPGGY